MFRYRISQLCYIFIYSSLQQENRIVHSDLITYCCSFTIINITSLFFKECYCYLISKWPRCNLLKLVLLYSSMVYTSYDCCSIDIVVPLLIAIVILSNQDQYLRYHTQITVFLNISMCCVYYFFQYYIFTIGSKWCSIFHW